MLLIAVWDKTLYYLQYATKLWSKVAGCSYTMTIMNSFDNCCMSVTEVMKQISLDGLAFVGLDICELHMLFWTPDNSFDIDLEPMNHRPKNVNFVVRTWLSKLERPKPAVLLSQLHPFVPKEISGEN